MMKYFKQIMMAGGAMLMVNVAIAQKSNTVNAAMEFKDAQENMMAQEFDKSLDHLLEAKKYIDQSAKHEQTATDPKTLKYKGQIYMMLAAVAQQGSNEEAKEKYANEETLDESIKAFKDAMKYDDKGRYKDEITMFASQGRISSLQAGIQEFQNENYESAYGLFDVAAKMFDVVGKVDTMAHFNAAISAERVEKYAEAERHYRVCAEHGYRVPGVYSSLSNVLIKQDKKDEAVKVVEGGLEKYPGSLELMIELANIHLRNNNLEAAEGVLAKAVAKDPENPQLHYAVGSVYDNLKKYDKAEEAYKKALSLDPDNFDANYSMGALKFNQGVEMNEKAGDELDQTKYEELSKKADGYFKEALPYLEKAHEVNPEDRNTMLSLKQLYPRMGMTEKYKEIKAKLQN